MGDATPLKKPINLLRGWPHPSLLPIEAIKRASQKALSDETVVVPGLCYGPDAGFEPLRESVEEWLSGFYEGGREVEGKQESMGIGIGIGRGRIGRDGGNGDKAGKGERICITGGASQNLACLLQVFADPVYTKVWMVAPCYFLACRIFDDAGLVTNAVPEGSGGVDLKFLEERLEEEEGRDVKKLKHPKPWSKIYRHIVYCVPTFSNPSGKTMSLACRRGLVKLARKYNALIITDDVYDMLQWPTNSTTTQKSPTKAVVPRLVDLDRTLEGAPNLEDFGNAVSNGSFSKIAGPGVRTGWAEGSPKLIYGLSQCGSSRSGGAPSQLTATMIHKLLISGDLDSHIHHTLIPAYKRRYEFMVSAITKYLLPLGVTVGETSFSSTTSAEDAVFGGYFMWINLPEGVNAEIVALVAKKEENLVIAPGKIFEVMGDEGVRFEGAVRLCFAWEEEEDLAEGVRRLASAVERVLERGDGRKGGGGEVDLALFR